MSFVTRHKKTISRIAMLAIFLALIRSVSEPFRLQYLSPTPIAFGLIKPFLLGGIIAAVGFGLMTAFNFYQRYTLIIAICILTIVSMLIVKFIYLP